MILDIPFSLKVNFNSRYHVADTRAGEDGAPPPAGSDLHRRFTRRLELRMKEVFPELEDIQVLGDYQFSSYTIPFGIIQVALENSDIFAGHLFLLASLRKTYRALILSVYDIFQNSIEPSQIKIGNPIPGAWGQSPSKRPPKWLLTAPFDFQEAKKLFDEHEKSSEKPPIAQKDTNRDEAQESKEHSTQKQPPLWLDRFINWSFYALIICIALVWTWQGNRRNENELSDILEAIQSSTPSAAPEIRNEIIVNISSPQTQSDLIDPEAPQNSDESDVRVFSNGREQ